MKYFIVADVHGFYDEMIEALNRAGYDPDNKNHTFVSLGDMFDRGEQANEVLDFLVQLEGVISRVRTENIPHIN